jgi:RNA polymerase sigma-70 factor (ECF subfamily)
MATDEELMQAYQSGDEQAFNEIYLRYKNRVYGYLNKKVSEEKRDDMFQMIFVKLHEKKYLFNVEESFSPWFFTLIRNLIIDNYRKKTPEFEEITEKQSSSIDKEESAEIDLTKHKLLYLKFVEGLSYKELEKEFNTSSSTLRKRISRLVNKIRQKGSF